MSLKVTTEREHPREIVNIENNPGNDKFQCFCILSKTTNVVG